MDKRRSESFSVPGGSMLMCVFAVLCLAVFAVLSLSTVLADGRLTEASLKAVQNYYEADCRAEETLARLRSGEIPTGVWETDGAFSYEVPTSETQTLIVEAKISGAEYSVLRWQLKYTADWEPDESINVWDGE